MVRQEFTVEKYWKVVVFYSVDYGLFNTINKELKEYGASPKTISGIFTNLFLGLAKAVTYSNTSKHVSIVIFDKHMTKADYLNSIVHEAEHIKQAMLEAYDVDDKGEPPAYTIGHLVMKMYKVFRKFL